MEIINRGGSNLSQCTIQHLNTLCVKLSWFCHTNSGQLLCNCPRSRPALGGKPAESSKVVVILLFPQNSGTVFTLLDENELQQLSKRWRNKNWMCSTELEYILTKLGKFDPRRTLIWKSISHLNLTKYFVNFVESFEEEIERCRS